MTDGKVLSNLLKQASRRINEILGDGAYDTIQCCETARITRAAPLTPPRQRITFLQRNHQCNLVVSYQNLYCPNKKYKRGILAINMPYQRRQ